MKKIRVLIVDDSVLVREMISRGISADSSIEVVGMATDPFMARDKIQELEPDVMTLDVEMPKMNGIDFLRKLMPQYPMPVVVVSTVSNAVFDALNAGAVDFASKPDARNPKNVNSFINELIIKIKIASTAKLGHWKNAGRVAPSVSFSSINSSEKALIAIGASTGGTEALLQVLKPLPKEMPPIVIVQHMPPVFTKMYAERLNNTIKLEVAEAKNGDKLVPGKVLIAAGDKHMRVKRIGGIISIDCFEGEKVSGHCPSVDVLFDSVSERFGKDAIGVILTGMGADGAKGLLKMRSKGINTIGQDEASCVVYGMPKVAFDMGGVERQLSLEDIPKALIRMCGTAK